MSTADQATIFQADQATNAGNSQTSAAPTSATSSETSEALSALVGEGKKYKTVDELAKAYLNADDFIQTLKAENHELKEKTVSAKTIDEVLERMKQQQTTEAGDNHAPSVTDITNLVEQAVTGLETKRQKEQNLLRADKLMKESFGEKAGEKFSELAVTPELKRVYMELAAVDPDKFVALFGVGKKGPGQTVDVGNNTSTTNFTASARNATFGTKEFFDSVRRTDPKRYYSQDFQIQLDKAVRTNPALYYGK